MESDLIRELEQLLASKEKSVVWDEFVKSIHHKPIRSVGALFAMLDQAGEQLDRQESVLQWRESTEERLDIITHKLKFIDRSQRPQVVVLNSLSSHGFVENDYLNNLIQLAGGLVWDGSEGFRPGMLLIIALDKPMFSYLGELPAFLTLPEWKDSDAVHNNKVYLVEEERGLIQPSIFLAEQVELLAQMIFPQYFVYEDAGDSWMQFDLSGK
ncbi:ABC transporter substrate-binding protein [Olivibacter sitiensis]|uniref:ABC transporter substrate-binding protein n=1 Tax=Olivibacter sitiensis TaxID=376470 RepID=UPI000416BD6C|nr:ABC transporter substrate-binding protein [Olivibacter sitiensis]